MNKVILTGYITKDLELRATQSGNYVCEFSLATNRPVTRDGERKADFINVVVWNKQAENLANYQGKGSLIAVEGNIRIDKYQDTEGNNRYKTYVLANNIEYLVSKKTSVDEMPTKEVPVEESNPFKEFGAENDTGLTDDEDLPF